MQDGRGESPESQDASRTGHIINSNRFHYTEYPLSDMIQLDHGLGYIPVDPA
jgi:hypothetical protein